MGTDHSTADVALRALLKAVRGNSGLTQYDFAATVEVSRKTVQRWEQGQAVPDARAEEALLEFCVQRQMLGSTQHQPVVPGLTSEATLRTLLAAARARRMRPLDSMDLSDVVDRGLSSLIGDLVGRAAELDAIEGELEVTRLVSVTGPGGVGKTAVALAASHRLARRFVGGVVFVTLAALHDPAMVAARVAEELGVHQASGETLRESLARRLRGAPTLLVLDNFEHVLAAAPLVTDLLLSAPQLRVLVTSRTPLRITGERELSLPALTWPGTVAGLAIDDACAAPAVDLFVRRATGALPSFALTSDNVGDVVELVARLDGLPLAIELAASRSKVLSPAELRDRLDDRFALLTSGARDLPERQRTLHATLDWSHDLLDERDRLLLRRLSVFAAVFTLEEAEAITADTPMSDDHDGDAVGLYAADVLDALSALVDHSMVQRQRGDTTRFLLLETVRDYACDRLSDTDERAQIEAQHTNFFVRFAVDSTKGLRGPGQREWSARLDDSLAEVRAVLQRTVEAADGVHAGRLATAMAAYWDLRGWLSEGREWLDQVITLPSTPPISMVLAQTWSAYLAGLQGDLSTASRLAGAALDGWNDLKIEAGAAYAHMILGWVHLERDEVDDGIDRLEASLAGMRAAGDTWGAVRPLNNLGEAHRMRGDLDTALRLHEEALADCRSLGDEFSLPAILSSLGYVHLLRNDIEGARSCATEAISCGGNASSPVAMASGLELLALVLIEEGDLERASTTWGCAASWRDESGTRVEARDVAIQREAKERVRTELGGDRFEALLAEGRDDRATMLSRTPPRFRSDQVAVGESFVGPYLPPDGST